MKAKEVIIEAYRTPEAVKGDPYIRNPREADKDPSTLRKDRETGETITLWQEKLRYPYKTRISYIIIIRTNERIYEFPLLLEKGTYCWNGSNIPSFCWSLLRISKDSPQGLIASLVHDNLLQYKQHFYDLAKKANPNISVKEFRELTTKIYEQFLMNYGVSRSKANLMGKFIDIYQAFNSDWKKIQ